MSAVIGSEQASTTTSKIVMAFAVIYLVWGTTYLAIKYALIALPPFTSGGIRMLLAAVLMYAWLRWRNSAPLKGVNWPLAAVCGTLMNGVGNGFVVWAQQGVPSGIAALAVASVPAVVLLLNWVSFARIAPSAIALSGMALAMGGFALVVINTRALSGHITALHFAALLVSVIAWSIGTLLQRSASKAVLSSASISAFTCAQLLFGGLFQLLLMLLNGEWHQFDLQRVTSLVMMSLLYLAIFGSVVAFNCYLWLLQHVPAPRVATYALVNPVVALCLGVLFLQEQLSTTAWLAVVLVLAGVGAVLFEKKLQALVTR